MKIDGRIGKCIKVKSLKEISGFKGNNEALSLWIGMLRSEELFSRDRNFVIVRIVVRKKKEYAILSCMAVSQDSFITPIENVKSVNK